MDNPIPNPCGTWGSLREKLGALRCQLVGEATLQRLSGEDMDPGFITDLLFPLVRAILSDWEEHDVRRYFELAYEDADMRLYVRTDSSRAAYEISRGVADMLVSRMRVLQAREERLLAEQQRRLLTDGQ